MPLLIKGIYSWLEKFGRKENVCGVLYLYPRKYG